MSAKYMLDAYARPANLRQRFANDAAGRHCRTRRPGETLAPDRIVFESTGPYQKAVAPCWQSVRFAVVVNARQVRDFAKGTGQLAKTDAIDAAILPTFGEVVQTTVRPLESKDILESARLRPAAPTWSVCSPLKNHFAPSPGWLRQGAAQHRTPHRLPPGTDR